MQWINSEGSEMVDTDEVVYWRRTNSVYSRNQTLHIMFRGGGRVEIEFEADDLYKKLTSKREIL